MMIKVRKAKLRDVGKVVEMDIKLARHVDRYHRIDYDHVPFKSFRKEMTKRRRNYVFSRNANIFVAEEEDRIVGILTASIKKRDSIFLTKKIGYLGSAYVDAGYRKRGIGKSLIQEALRWFKAKRIKLVSAHIDTLNIPSKKMLKTKGFQIYRYVTYKRL